MPPRTPLPSRPAIAEAALPPRVRAALPELARLLGTRPERLWQIHEVAIVLGAFAALRLAEEIEGTGAKETPARQAAAARIGIQDATFLGRVNRWKNDARESN